MENKNQEQKNNNENIVEDVKEIESLNDNEELDIENLEEISAAFCFVRTKGFCVIRGNEQVQ